MYVVKKYPEDEFICLDALTYAGNYCNLFPILKEKNFNTQYGGSAFKNIHTRSI